MKTIGITGGIGSGKSVVSAILKILNYPVYDSDSQAKQLMVTSPIIKKELKTLIGDNVYIGDIINKPLLSSYIFTSEENRERVNSIVHPQVRIHFTEWKQKQTSDIVFIESAILFESGLNNDVDEVWCVCADKDVRIERVMMRNSISKQEVLARINSQMSDDEVIAKSDCIIDNSGKISLLKQIKNNLNIY
ncbi:MAG: dephospho-CoA kinase [Bacteroidales bacterium]|nr:dephospho-CoA kinase [Bacteroidales bacterium]